MKKILLGLLVTLALGTKAHAAAVSLTDINSIYTQNFDGLANTGTANTTLPAGLVFLETGTNAVATYAASAQGGSFGTYSFGTAGATDRAFGTFIQDGSQVSVGLQFTNNTGRTINTLNFGYHGEQYRYGSNTGDRLAFGYSTTATALDNSASGAFTEDTRGDILSPMVVGTGTGAVAAKPTASINFTVNGLNIQDGSTFFIRFRDVNVGGIDDSLGVDDFAMTTESTAPVPEPSSWAMMGLGVCALLVMTHRRRQSTSGIQEYVGNPL